MTVLVDTSAIVAAAFTTETFYAECSSLFNQLRADREKLLLPATVTAEAGYLINRIGGPEREAVFLRGVADGDFDPVNLLRVDYARMDELVEQYARLNIGTTDASIIALAERLNISRIATLNFRDFSIVRPRGISAFEVLPENLPHKLPYK
jgi:uncharacterized protein